MVVSELLSSCLQATGRVMYFKPVSLLVCLLYFSIRLAQAYKGEQEIEYGIRLSDNLKNTRDGVTALKRVVSDIDQDLQRHQKRTCSIGGVSQHCAVALLDSQLNVKDWLSGGSSPGKRGIRDKLSIPEHSKQHHVLQKRDLTQTLAYRTLSDLTRKRQGLEILRRILDQMEADLVVEQKRTCKLNLGGHCATESAAAVADQWHYLNSPLSPGRKRRDTGLYKKLISGKILH